MKQADNREKNIQSYLNNKYMKIETNKKKIIGSNFIFIIVFLLCMLLILFKKILSEKIEILHFALYIVIGLIIFYLIIKYENWILELENNTIYIKRKIFPSYIIDVENIVNIQCHKKFKYHIRGSIYEEYLEITYFNKNNKIKKIRLYVYNYDEYIVEKEKIKEFTKTISNILNNKRDYNSDLRTIKKRDKQIEKLYKRESFIKKMNMLVNVFFTKALIIFRFVILTICILKVIRLIIELKT